MSPTNDPSSTAEPDASSGPSNFILDLVREEAARAGGNLRVVTRFPPEPSGYLHLGHAKAICLDFGIAAAFPGATCNLRFDDTNPEVEDTEFVESIQTDIRWLGFDWGENVFYASDYFEQLYAWAVQLIREGKAYVESLSLEEIRDYRGDFHRPGRHSPYRDRSVEENLDLFERMRKGEFDDGAHVLRAKIDMSAANLNLRDPLMYRIRRTPPHHRTGTTWCVYPMYDFAHGQGDAIEGITHSLCTLEFENHRPLYDWFLEALQIEPRPRQIEFGALNLSHTILGKRKLRKLVEEGYVRGWDDPRMPTLAGLRRRGVPPMAIRNFCERIGVSRRDGVVDIELFEHEIREELNRTTPRVMGVLDPLRLVITNFPADQVVEIDAPLHPEDPSLGTRRLQLTREVYIERDDFREDAPKKWYRFAPGREVRLRYGCLVTCTEVIKDDTGRVVELRGTWDPDSKGGTSPDGRQVRGTSHWVSVPFSRPAQIRLIDRLFQAENPLADEDFVRHLNPDAMKTVEGARVEPWVASAPLLSRFQFERVGYFCKDPDSTDDNLVFNRTIALRDSWAKLEKKLAGP